MLQRAQAALDDVRQREPSDSRHRRSGPDVTSGPTITYTSQDGPKDAPTVTNTASSPSRPAITSLPLAWESDTDDEEDDPLPFLSSGGSSRGSAPTNPSFGGPLGGGGAGDSTIGGGEGGMSSTWSPAGLDSWFGGKVDTGSVTLRPSAVTPTGSSALGVAVMDRPDMPTSLEFAPPEAPEESGAATIFPASLAMRFQSEEVQAKEVKIPAAAGAEEVAAPEGQFCIVCSNSLLYFRAVYTSQLP